jgi:hypothetical protein
MFRTLKKFGRKLKIAAKKPLLEIQNYKEIRTSSNIKKNNPTVKNYRVVSMKIPTAVDRLNQIRSVAGVALSPVAKAFKLKNLPYSVGAVGSTVGGYHLYKAHKRKQEETRKNNPIVKWWNGT